MKSVEGVVFWKSWNQKFCKVHRMTPNQTQGIGQQKYPTYVHCDTPSPNFRPFHSIISRFWDIFHILGFPLTPVLKFQSATKFYFWADYQHIRNFSFPHDYLIYHKIWFWLDETWRRSRVLKFPAPYGSVLTKSSNCHNFFLIFVRSPKTVTAWIPSWPTYLH